MFFFTFLNLNKHIISYKYKCAQQFVGVIVSLIVFSVQFLYHYIIFTINIQNTFNYSQIFDNTVLKIHYLALSPISHSVGRYLNKLLYHNATLAATVKRRVFDNIADTAQVARGPSYCCCLLVAPPSSLVVSDTMQLATYLSCFVSNYFIYI